MDSYSSARKVLHENCSYKERSQAGQNKCLQIPPTSRIHRVTDCHLGLGLCFASWLSISLSVLPYIVAALYRMHVEEQALVDAFGDEYVVYANETKRLIPGIY